MCLLMALGSRIECHASKNNLFDHWLRAVNDLDIVKVKIMIVFFIQCWVKKEFLSPLKIVLLCSVVLDLRALDVWPI